MTRLDAVPLQIIADTSLDDACTRHDFFERRNKSTLLQSRALSIGTKYAEPERRRGVGAGVRRRNMPLLCSLQEYPTLTKQTRRRHGVCPEGSCLVEKVVGPCRV